MLTSCQNFLNGKEIKEEIENQIAYANAPSYKITVEAPKGTGATRLPAGGEVEKKVTDSFTVRFEPASDWEFIRWKIVDSKTQTEFENGEYLSLSNLTEPETECKFLKGPGDEIALSIVPVMAERPQIISNTPQSSGVLKDTSIQVLFDHDMDKASIYYTQDEMDKLIEEEIAVEALYSETILNEDGESENVYKGYQKDGETFFKNILISNNRDSTNLNKWFDPPVFENSRSLIIRVKRNTSGTPLIQDYTQILVSVEKGMSYMKEGKSVGLAGSKRWMYHVGDGTDNMTPNYSYTTCIVKETGTTAALSVDKNLTGDSNGDLLSSEIRSLSFFDGNSLDVDLNLTINDPAASNGSIGSGPRTWFKINLNKVYDSRYNKLASPALFKEKQVDYNKNISADSASFEGTVTLDNLNLPDGVYELSFVFSDMSGNEKTSGGKYFAVDKTAPAGISNLLCKYKSNSTLELSWNVPASHERDIVYKFSYTTNGSTWNTLSDCDFPNTSATFNYDKTKDYHIYKVYAEDAKGNRSSVLQKKTRTKKMSGIYNNFVEVEGGTVSGAVSGSNVFKSGKTVTIRDMIVCDHEVTQQEYKTYCQEGSTLPDYYVHGDNLPAGASWYDAVVYCNLRSMDEGLTPVYKLGTETDPRKWSEIFGNASTKYCGPNSTNTTWDNGISFDTTANGYRLPTDAEWEYIARGGNNGIPSPQYTYSGSNTIGDVAWYKGNSGNVAHVVKGKAANTLGIYDMTGNVWEWCWDWYSSGYRCCRGNSFGADPSSETVSVARRRGLVQRGRYMDVGFRVVRNAD